MFSRRDKGPKFEQLWAERIAMAQELAQTSHLTEGKSPVEVLRTFFDTASQLTLMIDAAKRQRDHQILIAQGREAVSGLVDAAERVFAPYVQQWSDEHLQADPAVLLPGNPVAHALRLRQEIEVRLDQFDEACRTEGVTHFTFDGKSEIIAKRYPALTPAFYRDGEPTQDLPARYSQCLAKMREAVAYLKESTRKWEQEQQDAVSATGGEASYSKVIFLKTDAVRQTVTLIEQQAGLFMELIDDAYHHERDLQEKRGTPIEHDYKDRGHRGEMRRQGRILFHSLMKGHGLEIPGMPGQSLQH